MQTLLVSLILFLLSFFGMAQTTCNCCTESHQQFDFWVGDWDVYDTSGKKLGENRIEKLEKDCIISENWQGATGGSGKSYNYFNISDSTWNQVWISSSGNNLVLKGKASPNKMVLKSELSKGEKGDYYNRITWTKNENGSVTQVWEILDTQEKPISVAFEGVYKPKH